MPALQECRQIATRQKLAQRVAGASGLVEIYPDLRRFARDNLTVVFVVMIAVFSTFFHELMAHEGRSFSWATSVYWTLTTMTTLGFGDITFESDAGRIFSIIVLLSGSTFLLIVLPFVFIQFVFMPWMNERDRRRAPRSLPPATADHLILTELDDGLVE